MLQRWRGNPKRKPFISNLMALSAVTFKPKDKPEQELSTISGEKPLEEEEIASRAQSKLENRLFVSTTGMWTCKRYLAFQPNEKRCKSG